MTKKCNRISRWSFTTVPLPPHTPRLALPPGCCIIRPAWKTRARTRHFSPGLQSIQHPPVTWGEAFGVHRVIFAHYLLPSLYLSEASRTCTHTGYVDGLVAGSRIGPVTSGFSRLATNSYVSYLSKMFSILEAAEPRTLQPIDCRQDLCFLSQSQVLCTNSTKVCSLETGRSRHRARAGKYECCPA